MSDLNSKDHGWLYDDKLRGSMSDKEKLTKELILSLVWDMPRHNMEMATDVSDNAEWLYKKLRSALGDTADAEEQAHRIAAKMCPTCGLSDNNYCRDSFHSTTNELPGREVVGSSTPTKGPNEKEPLCRWCGVRKDNHITTDGVWLRCEARFYETALPLSDTAQPCQTCGTPTFANRDEERWWRQYCVLGPELRLELIRFASALKNRTVHQIPDKRCPECVSKIGDVDGTQAENINDFLEHGGHFCGCSRDDSDKYYSSGRD